MQQPEAETTLDLLGTLVSIDNRDLIEVVSRWPRRSPAALP
jgi:hypothetical protein